MSTKSSRAQGKRYRARVSEWSLVKADKPDIADALFRVGLDSEGGGEFVTITSSTGGPGRIEIDLEEIEPLIDLMRKAAAEIDAAAPECAGPGDE
jgi:hypothetical protein